MRYRDSPLVDFMETYKKHSDDIKRTHNDRKGRMKKGLNETHESVNQLIKEFQKININKDNTTKSNFTQFYFTPLKSLYPQYEDDDNNPGSEFGAINDPAIKMLEWRADKPFDFTIKGNSKHITNSLGWYTDVPVTLKDKENKTVIVIENFVRIDNREFKPMLFLGMSNIQKVQGILDPNNNQFRINIYDKSYIIPTFSKAPVAKNSPKETEITKILDSDELETRDFNSLSMKKSIRKVYSLKDIENKGYQDEYSKQVKNFDQEKKKWNQDALHY
ncbi:7770_t:CDS:2, partial [Acaulospora morrowiae]